MEIKNWSAIAGFIIAVCLLSACNSGGNATPTPAPVDNAQILLAEVEQLVAENAYSAALTKLDSAASENNAELMSRRGEIYLLQQRFEIAGDVFDRALEFDPDNLNATLGMAQVLLLQGQPVESRFYWRKGLELGNNPAQSWLGLGKSYLAVQDYPAAINAFSQAHLKSPTDESAWYLAALTAPQDIASAQRYLAQIENPNSAQAHLQDTLAQFSSEANPAEVALITGIALIQLNQWALAHHNLSLATEADPNRAEAWVFLGHAQSKLGLPAIESFSKATALAPELPLIPYFEGLYLRQQGLTDLALEKFLYALDLDPTNVAVALETAQTLTEMGDYRSAEAWYQSVTQADPDSVEYQQALTQFYVNRSYQIEEKGLLAAQTLVDMAPNHADAYDLLGWAEFQSGNFEAAEASLRRAIELQGNHVPAHYHLGRVLLALRRNVEAETAFTFVLDHDTSGVYRNRILEGN